MDELVKEFPRDESMTPRDAARGPRPEDRPPEPRTAPREAAPGTPVPIEPEGEPPGPLFDQQITGALRQRWTAIQASFVDEPRAAVKQADALVADAVERLTRTFTETRQELEARWDRGTDVSTEDLRLALQRYRSFFDRLLSV